MSDQVVKNLSQSEACPFDYQIPQSVEWMLQSIIATYDGSGAGGSFLPGVEIVGPGGVTTGIFVDPGVAIAAGSSGTVTFGPFLRSPGGTGGGIDFNKVNDRASDGTNANFLSVQIIGDGSGAGTEISPAALTIVNSTTGGGMELVNVNDQPMGAFQEGDGGMLLRNDGAGDTVVSVTGGGKAKMFATNDEAQVGTTSSGDRLLFYVKDGDIFWNQGGDAGSPIMALKWNGAVYDLHLQAGSSIIYDL